MLVWLTVMVAVGRFHRALRRPRSFRVDLGVWPGNDGHACSRSWPAAAMAHALLDRCARDAKVGWGQGPWSGGRSAAACGEFGEAGLEVEGRG
jgi:hypothetical protein